MSFNVEKLVTLLPAFYRLRDIEVGKQHLSEENRAAIKQLEGELNTLSASDREGEKGRNVRKLLDEKRRGPLKALLSIIAEQAAVLEDDLEQLYDDQFIETCAEWVIPYIGDLVGARDIFIFPDAPFSQRAQVANIMAYRRRKGTVAVLEQLARDVTAWNASVVEYFQLLATTQYLNHARPGNLSVASLRQWEPLERAGTPFDTIAHTVDVRRIESRRGRYNIPNIGLFLWRIGSYPLRESPAYKVDERRYLFDALGKDTQLYNRPQLEDEITHLAGPINVPMPMSRRVLDRYLDRYYGVAQEGNVKSILVAKGDGATILPIIATLPAETLSDVVEVCDLSDLKDPSGNVLGWANTPRDNVAIDPVLGRIVFPESETEPETVRVSYHYGFSADMGGGEYRRAQTFANNLTPVVRVPEEQATLQDALNHLSESGGVVEIQNNDYYVETPVITVHAGTKIELRGADRRRPILILSGDLMVTGGENAELNLNGFLVSGGRIRVPLKDGDNNENKLRLLQIQHSTLLPGPSPAIESVAAQPGTPRLFVELPNSVVEVDASIVGGMRIVDTADVQIRNSIVDASDNTEVAYSGLLDQEPGAPLTIENSTIIGQVFTSTIELASNTIFASSVVADRLQQGCVRYSSIPSNSKIPRPYRCQPDLALSNRAKEFNLDSVSELPESEVNSIKLRMRPVFTSTRYGDAGYCQLSAHAAVEIRQGADDEAEMGVFHHLYQPQREANLRARLDEYLRFGLEAGIFYAS